MESFSLLELPEEIQALVVERVTSNSIQDLHGLRASCKSMKSLAERRGVFHFIDVLSVPWGLNMLEELLKTCYDESNPNTLYIKGVQFFYTFGLKAGGLALMKHAAAAGYEHAVYTHAITRVIFYGESHYFAGFFRESVVRMGKQVRSLKWGWGLWHADEFRDLQFMFITKFLPSFYSCPFTPLDVPNSFFLGHVDVTKGDNMCDHSFWTRELGIFFRDFEPISLFRDTRMW